MANLDLLSFLPKRQSEHLRQHFFFFFFTIKQSGEKRSNPGQENGEINDVKLFSQVLLGFVCTVGAR